MRRLTLTSTTAAIALAIGQSAPLPAAAQTAVGELPTCTDTSQLPCVVPDLNVVVNREVDRQTLAICGQIGSAAGAQEECSDAQVAEVVSGLEPIPSAQGENANVADAASEMAEDTLRTAQAEVDAPAEEAQAAANAEAAEAEAVAESEAETQAAEAEAAAEAERQAAEAEAAEAEAAAEAERQAAEAEEQAAEAAAEAQAAEEQQAAEAEAQAAAQQQAAEVEAQAAEEQQATEAEAAAQAEAEAAAEAQTESTAEAEAAEAQAEATGPQSGDDTAAATEETAEQDGAAQEVAEQPEPQIDEDPAEQAAAQAEAAAQVEQQASQAAAASEDAEAVSSEEVELTEENTRSSDEEFETVVGGDAQTAQNTEEAEANAAAEAQRSDDRDDNVKNILTAAAAIGLGAYAIGQVTDDGGTVVSNSGDRVVVERDGRYRIIKDDDALLRRPGSDVRVQTFEDGSTRNTVTAQDGTQTVTIGAADGRVLRRTQIYPNGDQVVLFDDTRQVEAVNVQQLNDTRATQYDFTTASADELRSAIAAAQQTPQSRVYSLNQVRFIDAVRHQVPVIALDAINFETGSAVIRPEEAQALSAVGKAMREAIADDPRQVFLIEGHTDTVGAASNNLALSDRRAESVALALTEYFDVPPANMIVQGYGEADLKIRQAGDIRENRRAAVRNITGLLNES